MHMNVTTGNQWQFEAAAFLAKFAELLLLTTISQQFNGNPEPVSKRLAYPVVLDVERKTLIGYP